MKDKLSIYKYTPLHPQIYILILILTCADLWLRDAAMWKQLLQIHSDKNIRRQKNTLKESLQSCWNDALFLLHSISA